MKIDAKIKWLIVKPLLGIEFNKCEIVKIDMDYVEADEYSITAEIEDALADKYGVSFYESQYDFTICNMAELLEELTYVKFQDKVDPGYVE